LSVQVLKVTGPGSYDALVAEAAQRHNCTNKWLPQPTPLALTLALALILTPTLTLTLTLTLHPHLHPKPDQVAAAAAPLQGLSQRDDAAHPRVPRRRRRRRVAV